MQSKNAVIFLTFLLIFVKLQNFIFLLLLYFAVSGIILLTFCFVCAKIILKDGDIMSKICCFTGHREIKLLTPAEIEKKLEKKLTDLIVNEGFTDFRAGGAVGFDSIAALVVLKLKEQFPHVKLHLILPCKKQDRYFTAIERQIYKYTIEKADSVSYVEEHFSRGAMLARNRVLVDGSDLCIAYLEKLEGGTYYTVNYARKKRVATVNLLRI